MPKRKPKWDMLTKERKRECLQKIITFFHDERSEEIGLIAAESVLDFFMEEVVRSLVDSGKIEIV